MTEFLAALAIFLLATAGMAVGVMLGRKSLKGSCGGLAELRDEQGLTMCEACSDPAPECRGENAKSESPPAHSDPETAEPATR